MEYAQHNDTLIMSEFVDWFQSLTRDNFGDPKKSRHLEGPPSADQLFAHLQSSDLSAVPRSIDLAMFNTLISMIALQLLASCSTFLTPSSAEILPLYQRRTERQLVSTLQSHTQHRFALATGHQARDPSETARWSGFRAFPATRQTSSDRRVPKRRRTSSDEYTTSFSGSGWTDGVTPGILLDGIAREPGIKDSSPPADSHAIDFAIEGSQSPTNGPNVRWDKIPSSTSEDEPNFLSKLMCQPSTSKNAKHKPKVRVQKLLRKKSPQQGQAVHNSVRPLLQRTKASKLQQLTSRAAQRILSAIRLRRTQSAPRHAVEKATQIAEVPRPRRRSSNHSIGRPLTYHCIIPKIRRISATTAASNHPYASTNGSLRGSGRRELSPNPELFEEARRRQIELWQSKALFTLQQMKSSPPPSIRSPTSSIEPRQHTLLAGYFDRVYSDDRASNKTDDTGPTGNEYCAAGPDVNHCPRLQRVLGKMSHGDEDSSDSELERMKKRKSILIQDSLESNAMAGMFGPQSGRSAHR